MCIQWGQWQWTQPNYFLPQTTRWTHAPSRISRAHAAFLAARGDASLRESAAGLAKHAHGQLIHLWRSHRVRAVSPRDARGPLHTQRRPNGPCSGAQQPRSHATWHTSSWQGGIARCGLAGPASSSGRRPDSGGAGSCGPPGLVRPITPARHPKYAAPGARLPDAAGRWRRPVLRDRRRGREGGARRRTLTHGHALGEILLRASRPGCRHQHQQRARGNPTPRHYVPHFSATRKLDPLGMQSGCTC